MTKTDPRSIAFWCLTACALIAGAAQVAAWLGMTL